jgi:hypothetical protein
MAFTNEAGAPLAGDAARRVVCPEGNNHRNNANRSSRQPHSFDLGAIEGHVKLLDGLGLGCRGVLVLTPIWEGSPPRPRRFQIGAVDAMAHAIMAFEGVPGVNLYAQYGTMGRDLAPGRKGGEADVEAVFAAVVDYDNDKGGQREIPIEPSYVVESSPGNFQQVFVFPRPLTVAAAKPVLRALHAAVGGDASQKDACHVWRIPGTLNWPTKAKVARGRSPEPAPVTVASPWQGLLIDPAEILALATAPAPPHTNAPRMRGELAASCQVKLSSALGVIPSEDRDIWLRVGMALHGQGLRELWDSWSRQSEKFDPDDQDYTWNHFRSERPSGVTLGSIFYEARTRGWR